MSDTVAKGGRVLFVGTKRQAPDAIADAAKRSAQYYVNSRWLGGMLTNWKTISGSIQRLRKVDEMLGRRRPGPHQEGAPDAAREKDKLERALGGIKDMGGTPDLIFVIDTNKEQLAIQEAKRLGIPVAAIVDTNCDPDGITFPVPANDDAGRAISLYCDLIARAAHRRHLPRPGRRRASTSARPRTRWPRSSPADDAGAAARPTTGRAVRALAAPRGAPDDLTKLTGVGPQLEKKLNEAGIFHYWQLAAMSRPTSPSSMRT